MQSDGGVAGHIGSRFVNDADHSDGSSHLCNSKPIWPFPFANRFPDGICKLSNLPNVISHSGDPRLGEAKSVDGSLVEAMF